ncbi:hypothetical protein FRACYDRAFT_238618 [Fragilariopsis cylindrus CCMP1102]|uniref:Uncharacterized protein n=1 Tax=Fragilariopsis cylindrus CCMP1102 TaxID=635003 RepID=A0A1E7FD26_9STRA|nr:hypothetical protein FRACYDRAFT_238618 [Fragilariopsis cylindrus CCMP1102]|eukprot:OEU16034.1 hypothetical protein FRACYDRAFT_238618 [Fragilariopsis cylindrus CCMP1102]
MFLVIIEPQETPPTIAVAAVAVAAAQTPTTYDDISYYHTIYHTDYPTAPPTTSSSSSSSSANGNDQETEITESEKQNQKKKEQEQERTDPKDTTATSSDDATAKATNSDEQLHQTNVTANVAATAARVTAKMQQLTKNDNNNKKRYRDDTNNTMNEKKDDGNDDTIFTNDGQIKKMAKVVVSNKRHDNGGTIDYNNYNNNNYNNNNYNNNNSNNNNNNNNNNYNNGGTTTTTYACRNYNISKRKMGRKRKDHSTMPGQFDDAPESITGSSSSSSSNNNNNNNYDPNIGHLCSEALVTPYFRNQLGDMFDPNVNSINPETRRVLLQQLQQQRIEKLRSEQRRGQRAPHLSPLQRQAFAVTAQLEAAVSGLADPYQQQQQQNATSAAAAVGYKPVALTAAASEATVNSPHGLALQIRLKSQILKAHMEYNAALLAIDRLNQMPLLPQQQQQQQNQKQQADNQPTNNMQQS